MSFAARFAPCITFAEHFQPCSTIAYWQSQLHFRRSKSTFSGRWNTDLVGNVTVTVPGMLGAEHVQPCSMNASEQLPAATDELTLRVVFATQRRDFRCRCDLHSLRFFNGSPDDLPVASRQPTSRRPSRRVSSSLRNNCGFDLSFRPSRDACGPPLPRNSFSNSPCLGGAARYNQIYNQAQ